MRAATRTMLALATVALTLAAPLRIAQANGFHGPGRGGEEPPTRFERFVLSGCVPCVMEAYPVAMLPLGPPKLPGFPRMGVVLRPGELRVEALRAYELGRPSRQLLAIRVTLSVAAGPGGEFYRLAVGLLDEEEVPALANAVSDIARLAQAAPADAGPESTDTSFQRGSLRIGLLRFRNETVAYVQAGDLATLALRPVWDVPTTMYLPPDQLPALATAIGQLAAKIRQLRDL